MKPIYLMLAVLASACAGGSNTPQAEPPQITNYEAPGNLRARQDLGCLTFEALRNTYTAADLYQVTVACAKRGDLDSAVFSAALAGVYARYDSLRVADHSAHQAEQVLKTKTADSLTKEEHKKFMERLLAVLGTPSNLAPLCNSTRAIGPPNYYPAYMIQHGMGAFIGGGGSGLVAGFDSAAAWEKALDTYLHCPKS